MILAFPKIDHEKDYAYSWMPFSVLTVAQALLDNGLAEVIVFDGNEDPPEKWGRVLDRHLDDALCVGFSVMTGGGQIGHALDLAEAAKGRHGCPPLVFGGPHVNVLAEETARHPLADIVLAGPGQHSMPALVRALSSGTPLEEVPGLMVSAGAGLLQGPTNPPRVEHLSRYPWHLLDIARYVRDDPTVAPRTLNYVSSQGCAYTCRFCYELTYQRRYSTIGSADLVEDIAALVSRHSIGGIKFYDADFFINLGRVAAFCNGLEERGLAIRWAASINPRDVLRAEVRHPGLLGRMAGTGCSRLLMGVESGSDRVLEEIVDKRVTRAQVLDVARRISEAGILGSYTFIVGFPGETEAEQDETYGLIEELSVLRPRPETRVHLFAPYPGTPLFEEALKHGYRPPASLEEWSRYDYYDSQTPWTDERTVARARSHTHMTLAPARDTARSTG